MMRTCLAWITLSFTSSLALLHPQSDLVAFENGKPDQAGSVDLVQPVDDCEVILWVIRGSSVDSPAPGKLKNRQAATDQTWGKPALQSQGRLTEAASHEPDRFTGPTGNRIIGATPSTRSSSRLEVGGLSWIGSPGTNDFFLPNSANQPVFPASSQVIGQAISFSARASLFSSAAPAGMTQSATGPALTFREIPQTPAPKTVPRLIPSQDIRRSARRVPIILRAVPQTGSFRPASSSARIRLTLPRYQERSRNDMGTAK
ncbi:MAG: hypothetical protein MK108_11680 [Mariniblastus sp.]|nr:hypothetical protein [Mariniblastus sp.]